MDCAKENGVDLPGLIMLNEIYEEAGNDGHDDVDYAATMYR